MGLPEAARPQQTPALWLLELAVRMSGVLSPSLWELSYCPWRPTLSASSSSGDCGPGGRPCFLWATFMTLSLTDQAPEPHLLGPLNVCVLRHGS